MPAEHFHASCLICSWAYVGNHAVDKLSQHMREHNPDEESVPGVLSAHDVRFLKSLRIEWGED